MNVSEIFCSIQGEGSLTGRPSVFVRLAGCPLLCRWCDTKYARDSTAGEELPLEQIIENARRYNCANLVITGGEPFAQPGLAELLNAAARYFGHITLETAGVDFIAGLAVQLMSISPKLANSTPREPHLRKIHEEKRLNVQAAASLIEHYRCQLKFVVETDGDIDEIGEILKKLPAVPKEKIFLMPQAAGPDEYIEKSRTVADLCLKTGFCFSPRLQVLLWPGQRGK